MTVRRSPPPSSFVSGSAIYRIEKLVNVMCVEVGVRKYHPGDTLTKEELAILFRDTAISEVTVLAPREK